METILLAVIGQTLFAAIAGFLAAAMKRRWWVWVLVSLFLTPIVAYIGLIIVFFISGQPRRIAHSVKRGAQSSYGAVRESLSGESLMDDRDSELYAKAASEIASKTYDPGLLAKAFSEADGDENKAKARYIRYRVAELRQKNKKAEEEAEQQRQILREVNARDENGGTPLIYAAYKGNLDKVKFLVDNGADVNARDVNGGTPLMCAAANGHLDVVKYLLDKGAEVNARDQVGDTPLRWAASRYRSDVVNFLKQHGATK